MNDVCKRPESVLVLIHSNDGRILLLRRVDRPDFWQSVTGSLREGESPRAAAAREVIEETGFDPAALVDCGRSRRFEITGPWRERYAADVTHNLEHEFRLPMAWPDEPRLAPGEHDRARWCDRHEALNLAASWTNRAAIRMLPVAPAEATVVLVHGLWMGSPSMAVLAWRLRRAGFRVRLFNYFSTRESPAVAARRLARFCLRLRRPVVHFVAHSLGGLVLSHLFQRGVGARIGRAVLLGSPMQGSVAARGMQRLRVEWALGAAGDEGLLARRPPWRHEVPVATIVGDRPFGLGHVVADIEEPNDGAVALRETLVPGAQRLILPVTHSGLLVNGEVAARTSAWLREGRLPGGYCVGDDAETGDVGRGGEDSTGEDAGDTGAGDRRVSRGG